MSISNQINNSKLASGRFLLTIAAAFCFCWITIIFGEILKEKATDMEATDILPYLSTILIILSNIFTFYFNKKKRVEEDKLIEKVLDQNG